MKLAFKYAGRMWGIYAVLMLLSIFFVIGIGSTGWQLALGALLLVGFGVLLFNEGGYVGEKACTVRLAGPTCLAGDVIGDYSFDTEPKIGDLLVFGDMAIYTTCKNNTFNGMPLPAIYTRKPDGRTEEIVHFGYRDFKYRLGRM